MIGICPLGFASHAYVGGNLGTNYLIMKTIEDMNWSGATGNIIGQHANYSVNGDAVIGYAQTFNQFFLGLSGGITWMNNSAIDGTSGAYLGSTFSEHNEFKLNQFEELLIQFGYLFKDNTQLYITTGAANGPFHFIQSYKFTYQDVTTITDHKKSLWGFDIGVGIKKNISEQLALNVGIQNIKFQTYRINEIHGVDFDRIQYSPYLMIGKVGLEYRFG